MHDSDNGNSRDFSSAGFSARLIAWDECSKSKCWKSLLLQSANGNSSMLPKQEKAAKILLVTTCL